MRLKKTETKRVNESIEDDLFEEWVDSLDYDLIRNMIIPSDKLDEAVRDSLDESTSDEEIVDSIRNNASDWLEGNYNVEEYCISLLNDSLKDKSRDHKEDRKLLKELEEGTLDGDSMMEIIDNYGDPDNLVDWLRDDILDATARNYSFDDQVELLGLESLYGRQLIDRLEEFDLISSDDLSYAFEEEMENNDYWMDRKKELEGGDEDDEEDTEESFRHTHRRIENRRMRNRRVNEAYTSFTRWRNDIANSFHRWDWNVAKRGKRFPEPVWVDDLYTTTGDYIICVSLAPDGDTVSFNIFKGNKFPYDRPVHITCSKSDLHNKVDEIKGKVPNDMYEELKSIFSAYRFK